METQLSTAGGSKGHHLARRHGNTSALFEGVSCRGSCRCVCVCVCLTELIHNPWSTLRAIITYKVRMKCSNSKKNKASIFLQKMSHLSYTKGVQQKYYTHHNGILNSRGCQDVFFFCICLYQKSQLAWKKPSWLISTWRLSNAMCFLSHFLSSNSFWSLKVGASDAPEKLWTTRRWFASSTWRAQKTDVCCCVTWFWIRVISPCKYCHKFWT